ncbi:MAG: ribulose-phosphate 3-epimerase [Candidatus Babeliales bacterium]
MKIYPSLISAKNLLHLEQTITDFDSLCDGYHIDVMDDHFVPNLTWGPAFTNAIIAKTKLPVHVHLMVDRPEQWVERITWRASDVFIFHYEAFLSIAQIQNLISMLQEKSIRCGLALNPATPIDNIESIVSHLDTVLLMSVQPGFSGQTFRQEIVQKIPKLISLREEKKLTFTVGVDGGVNEKNIPILRDLGVDYVGVASAIFDSTHPIQALRNLKTYTIPVKM